MGIVTPLRACGPAGGSVAKGMKKISYRGYRFPPEIIHQAIWLYLRFTLSLRDVEDLLAERGIIVSYETVRRWVKARAETIYENAVARADGLRAAIHALNETKQDARRTPDDDQP